MGQPWTVGKGKTFRRGEAASNDCSYAPSGAGCDLLNGKSGLRPGLLSLHPSGGRVQGVRRSQPHSAELVRSAPDTDPFVSPSLRPGGKTFRTGWAELIRAARGYGPHLVTISDTAGRSAGSPLTDVNRSA